MTERIAIIGCGKIGEALLGGLINAGKPIRDLVVSERHPARAQEIADAYGVLVTEPVDAVEGAQVVFVTVKPDDVDAAVRAFADADDSGDDERLTVSMVAGVPASRFEALLPAGSPVIRVMPNTPMLVNEAMSAIAAGRYATPEQLETASRLLGTVGKVAVVPEKLLDAATAIAGSGPAYIFLLAEAMIDAGVALGMTRQQAAEFTVQTVKGAGDLLAESGLSPTELRAAVTSPAGTTAAAIREFERAGLRHATYEATRAAARVSAETARRVEVESSRVAGRGSAEGIDDRD